MEATLEKMLQEMMAWAPKLGIAILIFLFFVVLSAIARKAIFRGAGRLGLDRHITLLLARTSKIVLIILGAVTALGTLGINVSAIVAGLGLTGFALGFALKDTISNLLSGIFILLYKPFRMGDAINVAGFEGVVVAIDLRYTELESDDNRILIPNAKLFTDPIRVLHRGAAEKQDTNRS